MNSQENQDWEKKLQDLERQISQDSSQSVKIPEIIEPVVSKYQSVEFRSWFDSLKAKFNNLSTVPKVAVAVLGVLVLFNLIGTALSIVNFLVKLVILGILVYFFYKFFVSSRSSE